MPVQRALSSCTGRTVLAGTDPARPWSCTVTPDPDTIARNVEAVTERIVAAGGDPELVRIVAVTKGFGENVAVAAADAGLRLLGENYAQELRSKHEAVGPRVEWHFIGRLQRNKVRALAPLVSVFESVDRPALVAEIAKRAPGASVMIQVNISGEPQKGGCDPGDCSTLVRTAREAGLDVVGLMGVGPIGDPEAARPGFVELARLADEVEVVERSMGMTADLEVAVSEGATLVRVGTALFGPRPSREQLRN